MFINIEMDLDWTWGMDWHKNIKGVRLGYIAIHFIPMKFTKFMELYGEDYHKKKLIVGQGAETKDNQEEAI